MRFTFFDSSSCFCKISWTQADSERSRTIKSVFFIPSTIIECLRILMSLSFGVYFLSDKVFQCPQSLNITSPSRGIFWSASSRVRTLQPTLRVSTRHMFSKVILSSSVYIPTESFLSGLLFISLRHLVFKKSVELEFALKMS